MVLIKPRLFLCVPVSEPRMSFPLLVASESSPHEQSMEPGGVAVLASENDEHTWELLGDAADLAERMGKQVAALTFCNQPQLAEKLIHHGADHVTIAESTSPGLSLDQPFATTQSRIAATTAWYRIIKPRALFIAAAGDGRQLAAHLAARHEAELLSPALGVRVRDSQIEVTALHTDGRRARTVNLATDDNAIIVMNKDVGQARPSDLSRTGSLYRLNLSPQNEAVTSVEFTSADPSKAEIQHLPRLVAGGYGLGSREGFELLRSIARQLDAGIAASRMAVDLGWIERERQVGQSGRTVRPELYIACGISGASHHLEGMSQSRHVIALNTDPQAPIFRVAHLGLVADWQETLLHLSTMLSETPAKPANTTN